MVLKITGTVYNPYASGGKFHRYGKSSPEHKLHRGQMHAIEPVLSSAGSCAPKCQLSSCNKSATQYGTKVVRNMI